jgi:hypothetical protein
MVCVVVTVLSILRSPGNFCLAIAVIRMNAEHNLVPTLEANLFTTACNAIFRLDDQANPTIFPDVNLHETFVQFITCLPEAYVFPHRTGLTQALVRARMWVAIFRVDVGEHFEERLRR